MGDEPPHTFHPPHPSHPPHNSHPSHPSHSPHNSHPSLPHHSPHPPHSSHPAHPGSMFGDFIIPGQAKGGRPPLMTPEMMQQAQMQMLNQWRAQMRPAGRPQGGRPVPLPTMMRATVPQPFRPVSPLASPIMRPEGFLPPRPTPLAGKQAVGSPSDMGAAISRLPIFKYFNTVPPYSAEMPEEQFVESLSKFMGLINLPLRKVPHFKDRPIHMHALYRTVTNFGGFHKVTEGSRWNAVAASLNFSPITQELLVQLRSFYYTLFYAYEQVFYHQTPLDKVSFQNIQTTTTAGEADEKPRSASTSPLDSNDSRQVRAEPTSSQADPVIPQSRKPTTEPSADSATTKKSRVEEMKEVLCNGHALLRSLKAMPTVGKVSFEELTLMLATDEIHVQNAALGILERLSFDTTRNNLPTLGMMASVLNAITNLFSQEILKFSTTRSVEGIPKSTRPYDFLARKSEFEGFAIERKVPVKSSRLESIVNILRNWVTRGEVSQIMAKNDQLVWDLIVPSLTRVEFWSRLTLECYSGLWVVFVHCASFLSHHKPPHAIESLLAVAVEEVSFCIKTYRKSSICQHPALFLEVSKPEDIKRAIINNIKISNQTWKLLPAHCYLLVDFFCRILSNNGISSESDKCLTTLLDLMWEFVESFIISALAIAYLIDIFLRIERTRGDTSEYKKYSDSVLHNVNFGLPDGGYLELCLLTIIHTLCRLDTASTKISDDWSPRMGKLISWCDSLRKLWLHPRIDDEPSPLLSQPITAATSQPYLVLIRLYAILGQLAGKITPALPLSDVEMVVGWIASPPINKVTKDLLYRPEFVHVADVILSSITQ